MMTAGLFFRHVLRQILASTASVALVLLVILATYQLSFVLGRAADGQVPASLVPVLAWLSLRTSLVVILPFALLLGIVVAFGRLHHDNEITAAQSCGVPDSTLYGAAATVTAAVAVLAAWTAFVDAPQAARDAVALRMEAQRSAVVRQLAPGAFRPLGQGVTLYFREAAPDGTLRDVFLQRQLPGETGRTQVLLARFARQQVAADGGRLMVELTDGSSYEGRPGAADWRTARFAREVLAFALPGGSLSGPARVDGMSSRQLLQSGQPRPMAEWHWRLGWVLNVIILGLMAVPLSRLRPGQGRLSRVPWAVLLFAAYAGLLTAGRTVLGRGELPMGAGLWWIHAVALAGWWLLRARARV
jgi:lipopolysaccharide export system permease protein